MGKLLVIPTTVSKRSRTVLDANDDAGARGERKDKHGEGGKQRCIAGHEDTAPRMKRQNSSFSVASFGQTSQSPSVVASMDSRASSHVSTASSGASGFSVSYAISMTT